MSGAFYFYSSVFTVHFNDLILCLHFQALFEQEHSTEYVYKEPKVTGLTEICERLHGMYTDKFGKGKVKLIMDSSKVSTGQGRFDS